MHQLRAPKIAVGVHLAVFVEPYLTAVLRGKKTIESRFGMHRRPPYQCVSPNDFILMKRSGGPVVGLAVAKSVEFHQLSPTVLADIKARLAQQLYALDEEFWERRSDKQYASLIELGDPIEIDRLAIAKRDRQGWIIFDRSSGRGPQLDLWR
jgi:hypothetical protein